MPPAGFETAIPASERPQNHAFDRAATVIGTRLITQAHNLVLCALHRTHMLLYDVLPHHLVYITT